jgi:hypothetical protein
MEVGQAWQRGVSAMLDFKPKTMPEPVHMPQPLNKDQHHLLPADYSLLDPTPKLNKLRRALIVGCGVPWMPLVPAFGTAKQLLQDRTSLA